MILKHGLAGLAHKAPAGGGVTRRKLISTSLSANTGMHSAADITGVTLSDASLPNGANP